MRKELEDKYYIGMNEQLRNLAYNDWVTFCELIGEDALLSAKICILRSKEKTFGEIAFKLNTTRRKAQSVQDTKCKCDLKNKLSQA